MATRKKIGTLLDERLVKRAKGRAAQEGKESWGAFRVTRRQLREALRDDLLDA